MNKASISIVLLFVCLATLPLSLAQKIDVKPLKKINYDKILNTVWYQLFWADSQEFKTACCIKWLQRVCSEDPTHIWNINAYRLDDTQGEINIVGDPGKINPQAQGEQRIGVSGQDYASNYIVEHADDYSWMITSLTAVPGGTIDVLSKSLTGNEYAISRALELVAKYNLTIVHWLEHGEKCNYDAMLKGVKDAVAIV